MHLLNQIHWRPEIGDPSVIGWITVVAYFVTAAVSACATFRTESNQHRAFWRALAIFLLLLGINKQLDLQSLITEIGRVFAKNGGWYQDRRDIQMIFVAILFIITLITAGLTVWKLRKNFRSLLLPGVGLMLLVGFVAIRALSFHHVDRFLRYTIDNVRMNWLLELGGIGVLLLSGLMQCVGKRWVDRGSTEHMVNSE